MFNIKFQTIHNEYTMKGYTFDESIYDVIDKVMNSNIVFNKVTISDSGDVGMKLFDREYTYEKFLDIYDKLRSKMDGFALHFADGTGFIDFDIESNCIILVSKDFTLDLNDLIKLNDKTIS